jgi:heme/copper-type cytochrome/quinol oxidase subunit 2
MKTWLHPVLPWLTLALLAALVLLLPLPVTAAAPQSRTIRIQASQFAYSPAVLHANPGDQVTIELAPQDVVHGLAIDGYPVELHADPGQVASVTFTAERAGVFKLRCSVTCGAMHPFMTGKLQVGAPSLLWRSLGLVLLALAAVLMPRAK